MTEQRGSEKRTTVQTLASEDGDTREQGGIAVDAERGTGDFFDQDLPAEEMLVEEVSIDGMCGVY